ncbi:DUF551 domain-containing protein [Escherichia coli]|nr:DUF551 domain-containing protein [Escherichia coli]MCC9283832.1 DUF551 domain-containing protein [Escherichia coli]HAH4055064.1 Eaa protein [Escherichia coli]HAH4250381.1 Eaa protein [Escherichia coli]
MTTITDKKQYPGEQYLNELITNIEFAARAPVEVVRAMAAELQKRREADSAEPASNHEELPLDYLQGQKDGLEWAAQLAEANHPQTGDWLYDDPLELAKAIRKGPDMPEFDGPTPVTPDGLSTVCAEAYQVVGVMADALGVFGDAAVQKVLDNLSQQKLVHRDVLPFSLPVTPDGWISCSDRMPNDAQWCVVNTEYGYYVQCWSEGQGWLGDDISIPKCDVINWMPLPEPPQG